MYYLPFTISRFLYAMTQSPRNTDAKTRRKGALVGAGGGIMEPPSDEQILCARYCAQYFTTLLSTTFPNGKIL